MPRKLQHGGREELVSRAYWFQLRLRRTALSSSETTVTTLSVERAADVNEERAEPGAPSFLWIRSSAPEGVSKKAVFGRARAEIRGRATKCNTWTLTESCLEEQSHRENSWSN